ncbi:MAG: hypothetical protein HOW73_02870 [Polyangiaceae bacterium]|nr:hypothetical protein [Polyangiaceae bacterium]
MKHRFGSTVAVLFVTLSAVAGCDNGEVAGENQESVDESTEAIENAAPSQAETEDAPRERERGRFGKMIHHRGGPGPEMLLHAALQEEIGLSNAQRSTIETSLASLRAPGEDGKAGFDEHAKELAAAVRAGKVDVAKLRADDTEEAHAVRLAKVEAALDELHDTLTPEQRTKLVAAVGERMEEPFDGAPPGKHMMKGPREGGGPMKKMVLNGVELRDDQREAIEAAMEARMKSSDQAPPTKEEMEAQRDKHIAARKAFLESFAKDTFDAESAMASMKALRPKMAPPFLDDLAVVVPLLDADQREALASSIEKGPMGPMGRRGPGMR